MPGHLDEQIEKAIEKGQRTADAIPLIKRHCSHARVEHSEHFGWAPLEDMTGLPISVREMRCVHGEPITMISQDLMENAIRFYTRNCRECPFRDPQDVPNLKTVAEQVLAKRESDRERRAQEAEQAETERMARARARAERVASEPDAVRALIELLDGIDAEEPDARARELVDLCRVHPELVTPPAADVLFEFAADNPSEDLFEALAHLGRAGVLDRDRLLQAAVDALRHGPLTHPAALIVELQAGLRPGQLGPVMGAIAAVAAPPHDIGLEPAGDLALLQVAASHDLSALLDRLRAMIVDEVPYARRIGAGAAARLIGFEPAAGAVLVGSLVDALSLPESLSPYLGSPREEIDEALGAAFGADPEAVTATLEARVPGLDDEIRSALFGIFDGAIRTGGRGAPLDARAAGIAVGTAFRRLGGDWGEEIALAAARTIELTSEWHPEVMVDRVDALFGALMIAVSAPADGPSALELPPQMPPMLAEMEQVNRRTARAALIRDLREALGHLVPHAPEAVARNVLPVIEMRDLASEDAHALRDEAVRLLGDLGRREDLLPDVLPALWSALVHGDQGVRARAIEAWQQVAAVRGRELPSDLAELLPTLLSDEYVVVHTAMIRALRDGLPVPEAQLRDVIRHLLGWAGAYASKDSDVLEQALSALWRLAARMPDGARPTLREACLALAEHLSSYAKRRFVEYEGRQAEGLAGFPERLLEVLADRSRIQTGHRDDTLMRRLRDLPAETLAARTGAIADSARSHLPGDPRGAQRFVEVLQRAARWTEALSLAEEILVSIPDTTEHAARRDDAVRLVGLAQAEARLGAGDVSAAAAALKAAHEADQRRAEAASARRHPWEEDE